jgi:hypothetical protein
MELNKYFFEVLRNRLENILRPLSGNYKARIVYGDTTATDIKNTVILSARNEIIPGKTPSLAELYLSYKGSTAHEGGHIRYTSLSAWQTATARGPIFQHLTNIIEDGRIEALISERLPGAGKWIRFKNNYIYDNRPPEHYGKGLNAFLGGLIVYSVLQKIPAFLPADIVHTIKLAAPYVDIGKAASCTEDVLPQVEAIMAMPEVQELISKASPPNMLPDTGSSKPEKASSQKAQERAEKAEKIIKRRLKTKKTQEESEEENKPRAKSKPEDPEESKPEESQSSKTDSEKPEESELNEKSESTEESQSSKTQDTEEESEESSEAEKSNESEESEDVQSEEESDTKSGDSETTSGPEKSEESEDPDSEDDSDGSDGSDDSSISGDSDDADDSSPGEDDSDLDGSEDGSTNDSDEDNSGQSDDSNPDEPDDSDDADDSLSSGNSDDIDNSDSSDSGDPDSSKGTPGGDPNNKDSDEDFDNFEDDFFDEPDEEEDFQELVESLEEEVSTLTEEAKEIEEDAREIDPLQGINKYYADFQIREISKNPQQYQKLKKQNQILIKNLVQEIEIAIETRKAYDLRGLNRGRLNSSSLWKLAVPDPSIFSRRIIPGDIPKLAAYILVDCSGSMSSSSGGIMRIDAVKNAACVLSEACKALKIKHAVTGFDDDGHTTYHYPAVTWDDEDSSRIVSFRSGYANRDGFSIRIAANELSLRSEPRKILFVLSDGQPSTDGYRGKSALNDVKNAVLETKKKGMQVISLFFGTDHLIPDFRYMYDTPVFVNNINLLPRTLGEVFKKVLLQ